MNLTQDELRLIREALDLKMNAWLVAHNGDDADDNNSEYMAMHNLYHRTYAESAILKEVTA